MIVSLPVYFSFIWGSREAGKAWCLCFGSNSLWGQEEKTIELSPQGTREVQRGRGSNLVRSGLQVYLRCRIAPWLSGPFLNQRSTCSPLAQSYRERKELRHAVPRSWVWWRSRYSCSQRKSRVNCLKRAIEKSSRYSRKSKTWKAWT